MNLGLGLNIASKKSFGLFAPVFTFFARVLDDGGEFADESRAYNVYLDITGVAEPSLLCMCDAYKATKLYNAIPE